MKRNMWSLGVVDLLVGACCALLAFIQGSIDGNWADEHAITGSWDGGWQIACFLVAVLLALLGVVALAAAHDMCLCFYNCSHNRSGGEGVAP